jgi:hypothetical protein
MKGININCMGQNFCRLILDGEKTIETRNSRSLDPYIGQRVGLIKTGGGPAKLVGYVTVGHPIEYESEAEWEADIGRHKVYGGVFGWQAKTKYGYPMLSPQRVSPTLVTSKGIVARAL